MPQMVQVFDTETGKMLTRSSATAREMIATGKGRYADPGQHRADAAALAREPAKGRSPGPVVHSKPPGAK